MKSNTSKGTLLTFPWSHSRGHYEVAFSLLQGPGVCEWPWFLQERKPKWCLRSYSVYQLCPKDGSKEQHCGSAGLPPPPRHPSEMAPSFPGLSLSVFCGQAGAQVNNNVSISLGWSWWRRWRGQRSGWSGCQRSVWCKWAGRQASAHFLFFKNVLALFYANVSFCHESGSYLRNKYDL